MVSLSNIKGKLTDTEFEIGGTRFFVAKLSAVAGFDLLEVIRHEIGKSGVLGKEISDTTAADTNAMWLQMVLSLDPAFVAYIRKILFEKVEFSNHLSARQPLAGVEDTAFLDLEPVAIYEVLVRALTVNFTASLESVVSKFQNVDLGSIPSDLLE